MLEGLKEFAVAYLDDTIIFSPTWEKHLMHLSQVLGQIQTAGLMSRKFQIGMTEVQYLGHRVGGGTLKPEPGKVDVISAWRTPKMKKKKVFFGVMLGSMGSLYLTTVP